MNTVMALVAVSIPTLNVVSMVAGTGVILGIVALYEWRKDSRS